jgi:hypothetical protein
MGTLRNWGAGLALGALALGTVPAEAGGRYGPYRHHHRQPEKVKTSDVLIGAALVGIIAAIAAKKPKPAPAVYEAPTPDAEPIGNLPPPDADPAEAAAVDGCLRSVGEHYADDEDRYARVEQISSVEPTEKGFKVRGRVRIEDYAGGVSTSTFRCSIDRSGSSRSLTIG